MRTKRSGTVSLDLEKIREKLAGARGPKYWRSLEELAETEEFKGYIKREFPENADTWTDPVGRRRFLQLMGASLAFAGLSACTRQPEERLVPFVRAPEDLVPGRPQFYASAMPLCGYGHGILVESHDGRPTKIEGNPRHPASLGATSLYTQASILDLYDPDRAQVVTNGGRVRTWEVFVASLTTQMERFHLNEGRGLSILSGTVTSPTLGSQLEHLLEQLPEAKWHQYEPLSLDSVKEGSRLAFGQPANICYRFNEARVIVSLDADFLFTGPGATRYTKDFSSARRAEGTNPQINRLYMVESSPTVTGTLADHRLSVNPTQIEALVILLARELGIETSVQHDTEIESTGWITAAARDLTQNRGASVVLAGDYLPPRVHALIHLINQYLENHGKTVLQTEPVEVRPRSHAESVAELVDDMASGRVETLLILGGNPVFDAPADLEFGKNLQNVGLRVHLSAQLNETSELCQWQVPESHYLEAWGDVRAFDGTVSVIQPLIQPLYRSKTAGQLMAALLGDSSISSYDLVRQYWQSTGVSSDFEKWWRKTVHDGLVEDSSAPEQLLSVNQASVLEALADSGTSERTGLELILRPDPSILDGRFVNNGWLQELPKPLTKLTWDNAALISPSTAEQLNLENEQIVELGYQGSKISAPVWIQPGHPTGAVTLHLGYGRSVAGRVAEGCGFNAYPFRSTEALWGGPGLTVTPASGRYSLACTQHHFSMEGRNLSREVNLAEFVANPGIIQEMDHDLGEGAALYPPPEYNGYAWGMAVDLNSCIGCNACVIACQAENNIAVVGKDQVKNGREMHWIRIDRYYKGSLDDPDTVHQPVMCQHCENAPCESVCPVAATSHSDEGLNDMVYNRCVGTRYCSNNCPYKVRRFNFLLYSDWQTETLKLQRNPDVTVRSRGVMEKCTYCVQRINLAKIQSELEDRRVEDGDIVTACQQVCPADAIVFGDVNDPTSRVAQLKENDRNYTVLDTFNTRPRTSYLARLRNTNGEMPKEEEQA